MVFSGVFSSGIPIVLEYGVEKNYSILWETVGTMKKFGANILLYFMIKIFWQLLVFFFYYILLVIT